MIKLKKNTSKLISLAIILILATLACQMPLQSSDEESGDDITSVEEPSKDPLPLPTDELPDLVADG